MTSQRGDVTNMFISNSLKELQNQLHVSLLRHICMISHTQTACCDDEACLDSGKREMCT